MYKKRIHSMYQFFHSIFIPIWNIEQFLAYIHLWCDRNSCLSLMKNPTANLIFKLLFMSRTLVRRVVKGFLDIIWINFLVFLLATIWYGRSETARAEKWSSAARTEVDLCKRDKICNSFSTLLSHGQRLMVVERYFNKYYVPQYRSTMPKSWL